MSEIGVRSGEVLGSGGGRRRRRIGVSGVKIIGGKSFGLNTNSWGGTSWRCVCTQ
jgi:hypothetical protein